MDSMTNEEIFSKLCSYDDRNPNGMIHCMDKVEYEEAKEASKDKCSCDNCFYGRTELANTLLDCIKSVGDLNEVKGSNKKRNHP